MARARFLRFFFCAIAPLLAANLQVIRFGKLWTGVPGEPVLDRAVVIVDGNKIARIGKDTGKSPKDARVIDLRRYSGIPGMIDVHTHITYFWDRAPGTNPRVVPADIRRLRLFRPRRTRGSRWIAA